MLKNSATITLSIPIHLKKRLLGIQVFNHFIVEKYLFYKAIKITIIESNSGTSFY